MPIIDLVDPNSPTPFELEADRLRKVASKLVIRLGGVERVLMAAEAKIDVLNRENTRLQALLLEKESK